MTEAMTNAGPHADYCIMTLVLSLICAQAESGDKLSEIRWNIIQYPDQRISSHQKQSIWNYNSCIQSDEEY